MAKRGQELYRNVISWLGGLIVLGFVLMILLTVVFQTVSGEPNPYVGILSYMVFPAFVGLGIVVFLFGMRRESLRRRRSGHPEARPYPHLDLNDPRQRRFFTWALVGGGLFGVVMLVAGYHAFEFTESVTFCGEVCHTVMEPEHTAYQASPHARVPCVGCHVGPGAGWYVKSKMSGVRQVVAVTFDTYERPIATPIENLRPARETCEQCHWPEKFFGAQLMQIPHFRPDEKNTAQQVSLLLKTGGGNPSLGGNAGIHWHMILANEISYRAADRRTETIPWVRVKRGDGSSDEYFADGVEVGAEALEKMPERIVDCIECHNRPSHIYPPFETSVNNAMAAGTISPELPWIKKVAVEALNGTWEDKKAAAEGIRKQIQEFYAKGGTGAAPAASLDKAVESIVGIWGRSVFPKMKVDPTTYPMHIGHRNWNGCFRCHDGKHATRDGKVLTRSCTACHTAPERGPIAPLAAMVGTSGAADWHPLPLKGGHDRVLCTACHGPTREPPRECATCHKLDAKAPMNDDCGQCHGEPGSVKPLTGCRDCHEDLKELHQGDAHGKATCETCHPKHVWATPKRDACLSCHKELKDHHPEGACASCHKFAEGKEGGGVEEKAGGGV